MKSELVTPLALVVGGEDGVGLAIARRIAGPELQLHLLGETPGALEQALDAFPDREQLVTHKIDIGSKDSRERLLGWIEALEVPIRRLVTVSLEPGEPGFLEHTPGALLAAAAASEGRLFLLHAVARKMALQGGGSIAHVCQVPPRADSGLAGSEGVPVGRSLIGIGLHGLTRQLAQELGSCGVALNSIALEPEALRDPSGTAWQLVAEAVADLFGEERPASTGHQLVIRGSGALVRVLDDSNGRRTFSRGR